MQSLNNKSVNEVLNQLFVEEEDYAALRTSIVNHDNFDANGLAQQLNTHPLVEFRRVSSYLFKSNNRWKQSIDLCKKDQMYQDAMEYAAESRDEGIVEEMIEFFLEKKLYAYFAAMLCYCYDLLRPDVIMELAWKHKIMDFAMPYLIQVMKDTQDRLEKLEQANLEKAAENQEQERYRLTGKPVTS